MTTSKGSFDGIADKFDQNIYGTTKGRLRHDILIARLEAYLNRPSMHVLDIGGGTGVMSLAFASMGHDVTIIDISEDALDIARTRMSNYPNTRFLKLDITQYNVDIDQYKLVGYFNIVLCHAVLEWLEFPEAFVAKLSDFANVDGHVSLSFFNHHAKAFNNLLFANFDYIEKGMPSKNTVRLNPHRAQKPEKLIALIKRNKHYELISTHGIRCIHDYILDKHRIEPQYEKLLKMELEYGGREPFKWLGKYFHIMLKVVR